MKTLLKVEQLTITDSWTNTILVENINFTVSHGETLGIIGESGSGKSMTCKALTGLNTKRLYVTGDIQFDSQHLASLSDRQLRALRGKDIAMIMQQGTRAFDPSAKVGKQMIETMRAHTTLSKRQIKQELIHYMTYMNLKNPKVILKSYLFMLSGGMLQPLMIALALALKPKLIIADEPTTALDTVTQYEVLNAFEDTKQHIDCSMIFISHDLTVIDKIVDRVMVMKEGRLVETGETNIILQTP